MQKALLGFFLGLALIAPARAQTIGPILDGPFTLPILRNTTTYSGSFNGSGPALVRVDLSAPNILTTGNLVLNGTTIMTAASFAGGLTRVDRSVTLIGQNTFSFSVGGTRGQSVTLTVYQLIMPTPTGLAPNPLALTLGTNGTLTATLSPTPTASGTLTVSSSNTAVATVPAGVGFVSGQASVSIPVTPVASGNATVTASANGGSAQATVSVNAPPTVSVTSPASGTVFSAPASFTITATASDPDGTIARVDFFELCASGPGCVAGQIALGTSTAAPYSVSLANVAAGSHPYGATATDNNGARTQSALVSVIVNSLPAVSITSPTSGATFNAPANITITVTTTDSDGTIAKVDFYQGTTLLGTSTAAPYSFAWTGVAAGSYSLTAVATDDRGGTTTSAAVAVTVNVATTVQSLAPAALQVTPGATGTLTVSIASVQTSDTTVAVATSDPSVATVPASVVVLAGSTSAPFAVSAVAAGTAQVTASLGASSAASAVEVVAPPVVSGETPKDVTLGGGATPEVAASYSSPGSSIDPASVRLQLDGTDVTSAATVAPNGVLYLVTRPLADATHTVSLTVADVLGGTTARTWSFVVDDPAPNFYNETPRGVSLVDRNPRIRVLLSGFNIVPTSVQVSLDGADVTAQADVGVDHVIYTPATALADGLHTVSVSAIDGRGAAGSKQWTFTITTPPPPPTTTDGVRTGRTVNPTIRVLP